MKPSSMTKIREVPSKESNKNSGHKTEINKSFVFQADQSLVMKSKYLSESQTVFLRKDPQSAEELKSEAGMSKEPTYWTMNQRSQAIGLGSQGQKVDLVQRKCKGT